MKNLARLTLLMSFALISTGCASTMISSQPLDVAPKREQRKEEVIEQFESRRNQAQYDAALQSWERGDQRGCRDALRALIERAPEHVDARLLLSDALVEAGRFSEARTHLEAIFEKHPDHAAAHHSLGLLLETQGQVEAALPHYQAAVKADPENDLYRLTLSCCAAPNDGPAPQNTAPQGGLLGKIDPPTANP